MEARTLDQILGYCQAEVFARGAFGLVFDGICTDSRSIAGSHVFLALRGQKYDGHDFIQEALDKGVQACIVDRRFACGGVQAYQSRSVWFLVVEDTLEAYQRLAYGYVGGFQLVKIAITGSNGKTSTKEMIAGLLSQRYRVLATEGNLNNQVGVPRTLLGVSSEHEVLIVEMGAGKPGDIARLSRMLCPDYAVVTSVSPAHSEFLGDLDDIAYEKRGVFKGFHKDSVAILNEDEPYFNFLKFSANNAETYSVAYRSFSVVRKPLFEVLEARGLEGYALQVFRRHCHFHLLGQHNLVNLHFALLIAQELKLTEDAIIQGIESLRPLPMRMQFLRHGRYSLLLDCYNSNPLSASSGLDFVSRLRECPGRKICVLGDMAELGENAALFHEELGVVFACFGNESAMMKDFSLDRGHAQLYAPLDYLLTFGQYARLIADSAQAKGFPSDRVYSFGTLEALAEKLQALVREGDVVYVKASRSMHLEQLCNLLEAS